MSNDSKASVCDPASKLIFPCSGAADVGEISDRTARKLTKEGVGKMFCLAGVGGKIGPIITATKSASQILAIHGCGMDCMKSCLQQAGFEAFLHLRITDMGLEKDKSPATDQQIAHVAERARDLFSDG